MIFKPCISLFHSCDTSPLGYVYKPVFLLTFFAFFSISNLVPPSVTSFSPLVHLCRGDFMPHPSFATIVVKWAKTLQKQSEFTTVQVPSLGVFPLCPLAAVATMVIRIPLSPNSPMFSIPQGSGVVHITESKVRKFLATLLIALDIDPFTHTFHCFRRSGASLAFNSNVTLQSIKQHGTWSSDIVWSYIVSNPQQQNSVASTFQYSNNNSPI